MKKLIRLAILGLLCCVLFLGCSDNQVSVDSYFSSLTNEGNFIFASKYFLIFDGRTKEDFYYDGNKLRIIMLSDEGAYACPDSSSSSEIDLFLISYDDFSVEKINTVTLPGSFTYGGHIGNELYFRSYVKSADRNGKAYYTFFDVTGNETKQVDEFEWEELSYSEKADSFQSENYSVESNNNRIIAPLIYGNGLIIEDLETKEKKTVDNRILKTCEEGKQLLSFPGGDLGGFYNALEKDGHIYLLNSFTDDAFGDPIYYLVFEYDFETETVKYVSSIYLEEFKKIRDFHMS